MRIRLECMILPLLIALPILIGTFLVKAMNRMESITRIRTFSPIQDLPEMPLNVTSIQHPTASIKRSHLRSEPLDLVFNRETGVSYNVHAFYYPWYASKPVNGKWGHWDHETIPHWTAAVNQRYPKKKHVPPDDIASKYYPKLGPYSSSDPEVIRDHMRQLVKAGVGVLSVSWYPPETKDDNAIIFVDELIPLLLDIAKEFQEKICFHIEPYKDRSAQSVRRDIQYIINTYGTHEAFYRFNGKPLVYIYDSYIIPAAEWKTLLSPSGSISIRNTPYDIIAIGLLVEANHCNSLVEGGFDGAYTYFASQGFVYGSTLSNWATMKRCNLKYFIPSVGPGYDDSPVRPWNGRNTKPRNAGEYYRQMWRQAIGLGSELVSITSFNEWHEGSQIEEAVKKSGYDDYGSSPDFYLQITKEMVNQMKHSSVACTNTSLKELFIIFLLGREIVIRSYLMVHLVRPCRDFGFLETLRLTNTSLALLARGDNSPRTPFPASRRSTCVHNSQATLRGDRCISSALHACSFPESP